MVVMARMEEETIPGGMVYISAASRIRKVLGGYYDAALAQRCDLR